MFSLGNLKIKKKKKKKRLLCAFVCPSWFKETRGLHSVRRSRAPTKYFFRPFPAGCPGVFFFRPFPAGSLCRRRTCPGLIPGFFFSPPYSGGLPRVNTRVFFSPPFSGGLPRVNTRVFFFFFFPPFSKKPGDFTVSEGHEHPIKALHPIVVLAATIHKRLPQVLLYQNLFFGQNLLGPISSSFIW